MTWLALGPQHGKAIEELVHSDSQRIVAVVGGALLDNNLRAAIESRMRPDKDRRRRLFGPNGPMGTQNKATLAYLLGMYDENCLKAIEAIYDIRNLFAHNLEMTFNFIGDTRMSDAFSKLTLHQMFTHYPHPFIRAAGATSEQLEEITDLKTQFIVNLKLVLVILFKDKERHLEGSNLPTPHESALVLRASAYKSAAPSTPVPQTPPEHK